MTKKNAKESSKSLSIMNELVLPNDTNTLNYLRGGKMLHWMDICSAIAAQRHSNSIVVTVSVDGVSFREPIQLGDVVKLEAYVTRSFNTSMEVYIKVWTEDIPNGEKLFSNDAYYTFVAIDSRKKPKKVPEIIPVSEEEIEKYEGALRRRQIRLIMAKKIKPNEATELRDYLNTN